MEPEKTDWEHRFSTWSVGKDEDLIGSPMKLQLLMILLPKASWRQVNSDHTIAS